MDIKDFPETVCSLVPSTERRTVNVVIPEHLVDHPTRTVSLMIKNRSNVDVYIKPIEYAENSALRITSQEYEAIEFTPIAHSVTLEVWSKSFPTNAEGVEIVREG